MKGETYRLNQSSNNPPTPRNPETPTRPSQPQLRNHLQLPTLRHLKHQYPAPDRFTISSPAGFRIIQESRPNHKPFSFPTNAIIKCTPHHALHQLIPAQRKRMQFLKRHFIDKFEMGFDDLLAGFEGAFDRA